MNQLGVHLGGSPEVLFGFGMDAVKQGVRTFQVHVSNPRRWEEPKGELLDSFIRQIRPIVNDSDNPDINLVIHGPFGVSLSKSEHFQYVVRYFIEVSRIVETLALNDNDRVRLVTHVGSRIQGLPISEIINQIHRVCTTWDYYTSGHRSVLCLENDAGSKNGTKIGSVKFLKEVLNGVADVPRIRMCWDTEHAFANGFDLVNEDRVNDVLTYSDVVHLNSIPSFVSRGGHLDRHSDTLVKDGQCVDELLNVVNKCRKANIPMILERSRNIVMEDYAYIIEKMSSIN